MLQDVVADKEVIFDLGNAKSFCVKGCGRSRRFAPDQRHAEYPSKLCQAIDETRANTPNARRNGANHSRMDRKEFQNEMMTVGATTLGEAESRGGREPVRTGQ